VLGMVRLDPGKAPDISRSVTSDAQVFADARRSRTFWLLMAAFFLLALGCSGLIVHLVPLLTDAGVSGAKAASIASLSGLSVVGGRLLVGYLVDRFPAIYVAAIGLGFSAAGCLSLACFGVGAAPAAAIAIGFAIGAEVDLIGFLTAAYFGLRAYGRLYGWQYGAFVLGTGLGPLWVAAVYDHTGSYQIALYGVAALLLAAAALFLACPHYAAPTRPSASAPEKRATSMQA
jgi:predicted MFS family arabinose efflux permease